MKRLIPFLLCLGFVLVVSAVTQAQAADQQPFVVHFVVVSKAPQDGADPELLQFKEEVVKLAGGYTELGPTSGGVLTDEGIRQQDNVSFIIGADKDISQELRAMTKRIFGDAAFILSWQGKVLF